MKPFLIIVFNPRNINPKDIETLFEQMKKDYPERNVYIVPHFDTNDSSLFVIDGARFTTKTLDELTK